MYTNFNRSKKPSYKRSFKVDPYPKTISLISERPIVKDGITFSELFIDTKPIKADPTIHWMDLEVSSLLAKGISVENLPLSFYHPNRQAVLNSLGNVTTTIDEFISEQKNSLEDVKSTEA